MHDKPCSNGSGEHTSLAVVSGNTIHVITEYSGLSASLVAGWYQRYRVIGSVAPSRIDSHRKRIPESHCEFIIDQMNISKKTDPDALLCYQSFFAAH